MKYFAAMVLAALLSSQAFAQCSQKAEAVIRSLFKVDHPNELIQSVYSEQQVPKTVYEVEVSSNTSEDAWPAHWVYRIAFDNGICRVKTLRFLEVYH